MGIAENYKKIRNKIPDYVTLVVAVKKRTKEEIEAVLGAGATDLGENYVQEAQEMHEQLGEKAKKADLFGPREKSNLRTRNINFE